jgi:glycosyltransferase involved in cell wall biosynthesis
MNAFTGGCHYSLDCFAFTKSCGACPQLGSDNPRDISFAIWKQKRDNYQNFSKHDLHIIAPSQWMAKQARLSSLLKNLPSKVIPYGQDLATFTPRERVKSRDYLGIPQNKKILLFVANSVKIKHKGFGFLTQALKHLDDSGDVLLVSLGSGAPAIDTSIPHLHLGYFSNNQQIARVYSSADVFIIPSMQDNLPNTVMESLACGTPVVGFDVGGIPDMVRPGVTGLLVPPKDVKALGEAIQTLLKNDTLRAQMSENCRRIAVEEYSLEIQALRYIALYQEIISMKRKSES